MFSAFKKLANRNDGPGCPNGSVVSPVGVQSMAHNLQKKFAKGCNYNMKLVIRGDKNTGKSCLLARLQGGGFKEEYCPTEEIQVASINWSYKNTEDIVKVEVWDVVDIAKKRKKLTGLKVGTGETEEFEPGLDAQFLDVYKQAHGAILIFDITKPWTFEYVKKELERVPSNIPVLLLASFSDMSHHRQVSKLQIADFVENVSREGTEPAEVRWSECSLRNGFGLKFLHKFFNVPFLTLQRSSLLQQLEQNLREIQATHDELDLYMESDDASYERFSENMAQRRRQAADNAGPSATRSIVVGQNSSSSEPRQGAEPVSSMAFSNRSNQAGSNNTVKEPEADTANTGGKTPTASGTNGVASKEPSPVKQGKIDVENFVPDSGDFDNFLEDENSAGSSNQHGNGILDSSDEETEDGNPMVSKFEDEVDFEDYQVEDSSMDKINAVDQQTTLFCDKSSIKINAEMYDVL